MKKVTFFVIEFVTLVILISCNKENSGKMPPTVDFTFTIGNCNPTCQVNFSNQSTNATDYLWSFGDGTSSTETNPTKIYNASGTYSVTLKATSRSGSASVTKPVILQSPRPAITITPLSPFTIYLPNNCGNSFRITNSGPQGSMLNYAVYDNSPLGGFLNFTNGTGSLSAGSSATITVTVDPRFVSGQPSLIGFTLPLDISTPDASNATHSYANFPIASIDDEAQNLLGSWTGNWSGNSYGASNPGQPSPTTPVSGTWTLNVQTINLNDNTVTGTLTWNGNDAYWRYTFDNNGNITSATPQPFNANISFSFNGSNSYFQFPVPGAACDRFRLLVNDLQSSAYGVYGPRLLLDVDLISNNVITSGSSFTAWPYAPVYINNLSSNQSNGGLSGHK